MVEVDVIFGMGNHFIGVHIKSAKVAINAYPQMFYYCRKPNQKGKKMRFAILSSLLICACSETVIDQPILDQAIQDQNIQDQATQEQSVEQPKIQAIDILYTMKSMLANEYVVLDDIDMCKLNSLSNVIYNNSLENTYFTQEQSVEHLLALGWNETRFSYNTDHITPNYYGEACGVYQQTDKLSMNKFDCVDLLHPTRATKEALDQLKYIKERWNGKLDKTICHYFSGNKCDDKASEVYASNHKNARAVAKEFLNKAKNIDHSDLKKVIATCN
jgi:hypothetical protein